MATGTGIADTGVSYASVEEVENSTDTAHGISNVYAAKKYGRRWRKKAALYQRELPRESEHCGPETHGRAEQTRVPSANSEIPRATPRRRSSSGEAMVVTSLETVTQGGHATAEARISPRRPSFQSGRRSSRVAPADLGPQGRHNRVVCMET